MILRPLKGRGMVSGLFEMKRDAIPPHPALSRPASSTVISAFSDSLTKQDKEAMWQDI
jgi:hypothetical protein